MIGVVIECRPVTEVRVECPDCSAHQLEYYTIVPSYSDVKCTVCGTDFTAILEDLDGGALDLLTYCSFLSTLALSEHRLVGTKHVKKVSVDVIDELLHIGRKLGLTVNFDLDKKVFRIL